jgi:hypothetical protein
MKPESLLPRSQEPTTCPYFDLACTEVSVRFRGLCVWFVTCLSFYGEELLALRPTTKLEDHPCRLSAAACSIYSLICRSFLQPQPEDTPCRGDRDPLFTVTGTHFSQNFLSTNNFPLYFLKKKKHNVLKCWCFKDLPSFSVSSKTVYRCVRTYCCFMSDLNVTPPKKTNDSAWKHCPENLHCSVGCVSSCSKHHRAWWLSEWKGHFADKMLFKFRKPSDVSGAPDPHDRLILHYQTTSFMATSCQCLWLKTENSGEYSRGP